MTSNEAEGSGPAQVLGCGLLQTTVGSDGSSFETVDLKDGSA